MPTFIKTGFWEQTCRTCKGYNGWLNLDQFIGGSGTSGVSGTSGISGSAGTSGASGTSGSAGTTGLSGSSGSSGRSGTSGLSGDRYRTESVTEFTLGTGGTITVGTGLSYTVAQDIIISYDSANHQVSMVVSYDSGTGILVFGAPSETTGTGTFSDWTVNLNGAAGGDGSSGTSGSAGTSSNGSSGTSGAAGTSGSAGTSGATGTSGSSGTSASSGTAGTAGLTGTSGTSGVNGAVGGYLGSFYDTTTQTGVAGSVLTMGLSNSDSWNNGVSLVSGNQITIANPGVYNIQFSAQMVKNAGNTATHAHIWLAQNGTNVATSASQLGFPSNSIYVVAAWNFFFKTTVANEYVQLKWEINSNADNAVAITSAVASGDIPAIPGLIVTVNQVG